MMCYDTFLAGSARACQTANCFRSDSKSFVSSSFGRPSKNQIDYFDLYDFWEQASLVIVAVKCKSAARVSSAAGSTSTVEKYHSSSCC